MSDIWFLCLDLQNSTFEIIDSKLQNALCEYIVIMDQPRARLTLSIGLPGKMLPINFSTHCSSASEVVACHRYKQLNYSIIVSQESKHINENTYLNTADISTATLEELVINVTHFLRAYNQLHRNGMIRETTDTEGIQAPGATLANEAEDAANVVRKDRTSEPRAIDEARRLEDLLFLIGNLLYAVRILQGDIIWVLPRATLINLKQFVCDVLNVTINNGRSVIARSRTYVVIAVEQHEQNADSGWKQEKTILGKCVRLE